MTTKPHRDVTGPSLDVDGFARDGFVAVRGFLSPAQLDDLRAWVTEIEAWPAGEGGWFQHDEQGERGVVRTRTENFSPFHDGLRGLLTEGALPDMAAELLGEPAVLYKEKVNYKHAGGAGFSAHQDAPAYPHLPVSVACLLAVDDSTTANGCLELAAGLHNRLLPTDGDGCVRPDVAASLGWAAVPVEAGSLLWFHSHTPHRSAKNSSDNSRRALYLTYNAASIGDLRADYYAEKRAAFDRLGVQRGGAVQRVSLIGHFQGVAPGEVGR